MNCLHICFCKSSTSPSSSNLIRIHAASPLVPLLSRSESKIFKASSDGMHWYTEEFCPESKHVCLLSKKIWPRRPAKSCGSVCPSLSRTFRNAFPNHRLRHTKTQEHYIC